MVQVYVNTIAFSDFFFTFFSFFNAKVIKNIILSRNVFFTSFLVE
jgi:hypothetical protein